MAIDVPVVDDPVVASSIVSWRVEIESPPSVPVEQFTIRGHRQIVDTKQSGATATRIAPNPLVQRTYQQIADQSYTADGVTVTGAQLFALIAEAIDSFDVEDTQSMQAMKGGYRGS